MATGKQASKRDSGLRAQANMFWKTPDIYAPMLCTHLYFSLPQSPQTPSRPVGLIRSCLHLMYGIFITFLRDVHGTVVLFILFINCAMEEPSPLFPSRTNPSFSQGELFPAASYYILASTYTHYIRTDQPRHKGRLHALRKTYPPHITHTLQQRATSSTILGGASEQGLTSVITRPPHELAVHCHLPVHRLRNICNR